ncbi:MAG TPA: hypothetical protein VMX36_06925 [Sedimentisphaerales bacterium]|nr:hypothetical protein [Sedimentisphaerales bacterium]
MDVGDWITRVSSIAAVVSVIIAVRVLWDSKSVLKYQTLAELTREYAQSEMGDHVKMLWNFYRQRNRDKKQVRSVFKNHLKEMDRLQDQSPHLLEEFGGTKLNLARRQVKHFYQRMAVLRKGGIVSNRILYRLWTEKTLQIISEILIPLEETLLDYRKEERGSELDDLEALYKDSNNPRWCKPKWWWKFVD